MNQTTKQILTVAIIFVSLNVIACKSKEDNVRRVCQKIYEEAVATCGGDAGCKAEASASRDSCYGLATSVGRPRKSAGDSVAEAKAACDEGDAKACSTYGAALLLGKGIAKDPDKGFGIVRKACEAADAFGCEVVGRAYEKGLGVTIDMTKKNEYMQQACTLGSGAGCRSVGLAQMSNDPSRIRWFQLACDKNDGLGCMGIGAAYLHGQGVAVDKMKAKTYLQKACDVGESSACAKAGEL